MSDIASFDVLFPDLAADPERPLNLAAARNGIGALRKRCAHISAQAAALSAAVRIQQSMVDSVLAALVRAGEPLPAALAAPATTLDVSLTVEELATAEVVIEHLQHGDSQLSIDDCINEIFTTGLATLAYRLNLNF